MASSNSKVTWQHNLKTINERIEFLYNNKEMSDFNFIVGPLESIIPAHKFVLSVTSEIFNNMFNRMQTDNRIVKLPNTPYLSFLEFLSYIYKNEFTLNMANANDILQLSIDYDIPDLKIQCLNYLRVNINNCTVFKILSTSSKFNLINLKDKCLELIGQNFKFIFRESDDFLHTDQNTLEIILQSNYFKCSEYEIFLGINKWLNYYCKKNKIEADLNKRKELNQKLFKYVRYDKMSVEEFRMCTKHNILTAEEIGTIFQKLGLNSPSQNTTRYDQFFQICNRFLETQKIFFSNNYHSKTDLNFYTNKPIIFCGLGLYGPTVHGCKKMDRQDVLAELRDAEDNILTQQKQYVIYDGTCKLWKIVFDKKIMLKPNKEYLIIVKRSTINDENVEHYTGIQGQGQITFNEITFNFKDVKNVIYGKNTFASRLASIIFRNF